MESSIGSKCSLAFLTQSTHTPENSSYNDNYVHMSSLTNAAPAAEVRAQETNVHEAMQSLLSRFMDRELLAVNPQSKPEILENHLVTNSSAPNAAASSTFMDSSSAPHSQVNLREALLHLQALLDNVISKVNVSNPNVSNEPLTRMSSSCSSRSLSCVINERATNKTKIDFPQTPLVRNESQRGNHQLGPSHASIGESSALQINGAKLLFEGGSYKLDPLSHTPPPQHKSYSHTQATAREPERAPAASATGRVPGADAGRGVERGEGAVAAAARAPACCSSSWSVEHVVELVRALCLPALSPPANTEFLDRLVRELVLLRARLEVCLRSFS